MSHTGLHILIRDTSAPVNSRWHRASLTKFSHPKTLSYVPFNLGVAKRKGFCQVPLYCWQILDLPVKSSWRRQSEMPPQCGGKSNLSPPWFWCCQQRNYILATEDKQLWTQRKVHGQWTANQPGSNGVILKPSFYRDAVSGLYSLHMDRSFEHCGSHQQGF